MESKELEPVVENKEQQLLNEAEMVTKYINLFEGEPWQALETIANDPDLPQSA